MLKLEYYQQKFKNLPYQGSNDWLEGRLYSFGGSEMATLLGKNPYETWEDLKHIKTTKTSLCNDATQWGHWFEPVAKTLVEKQWGKIYEFGSIPHSFYPVCYSPDGLMVIDNELVLLEIKTPIQRGIKKIKPCYWYQVQTGLNVISAKYCLFAQFRFRRCKWNTNPLDYSYDRGYHMEFRKRQVAMLPMTWGFFWWDIKCALFDLGTVKNMYEVIKDVEVEPQCFIYPGDFCPAVTHGIILMWKCFEESYSSIKREPNFLTNQEEHLWKMYYELRSCAKPTEDYKCS